jgi:hypothetical protein
VIDLSLIIVSYDTAALTCDWLESVPAADAGERAVFVVDNASADGSARRITCSMPGIIDCRRYGRFDDSSISRPSGGSQRYTQLSCCPGKWLAAGRNSGVAEWSGIFFAGSQFRRKMSPLPGTPCRGTPEG